MKKLFLFLSLITFSNIIFAQTFLIRVDTAPVNLEFVANGNNYTLDKNLCIVNCPDSLINRQPCKMPDLMNPIDEGDCYGYEINNSFVIGGVHKIGTPAENKVKLNINFPYGIDNAPRLMTFKFKIVNSRIRLSRIIEGVYIPGIPPQYNYE